MIEKEDVPSPWVDLLLFNSRNPDQIIDQEIVRSGRRLLSVLKVE